MNLLEIDSYPDSLTVAVQAPRLYHADLHRHDAKGVPLNTEPHIDLRGHGPVRVGTIYCIGRNYAEHARELNNPVPAEPVVFMKAAAALRPLAAGDLAFADETFHHEAELVLLIGTPVARGESPTLAAVRAMALGLDLTRRETQTALKAKGLPWTTAKSFAGSAIVTPFVDAGGVKSPLALRFSLDVNGETKQAGTTSDMLFPLPTILAYLASLAPLHPGDLVFTGTPSGVGPLRRGDRIRLKSEDLGLDETGRL